MPGQLPLFRGRDGCEATYETAKLNIQQNKDCSELPWCFLEFDRKTLDIGPGMPQGHACNL